MFYRGQNNSYDVSSLILSNEDNLFSENEIKIYPNPVKNDFHINHTLQDEGTIIMYDINGRVVKTLFEGNFGSQSILNFTREGISSGIYFVTFKTNTNSITKKLILQ